ncbi:Fe-S cluster assembly ATPase SufC [Candidatus Roizmanbacteria bacterium CG_4_9_14_0_2_um_filter_39_13]|uniref:Fe-S cluster assembly ATPase SufC n=1 Tax=Candidatus Roizmanbacteria bacterium CG_4_9_14_0_2_um_filter_39_13 TaxID=1974839 RepID=A0A2M8EWY4_9BACT|nr:MAG: Fe-S cluster assembly ATPase SufC [Candidatus Roizmanbacteria bacterium CG_4_10_14_0_2_um_filter_39_12]PJC30388.1 MAG: Fe-S cluster assembly ATPase SufC [Candidatus Roizmanbacteria bacterium CG_4_9_14_0_2_um_filter_39_13]
MLKINNLIVSIDGKTILNDINFIFEKGKTYAIMGPNGSGKSTLAYSLMGHPAYKISNSKSQISNDNTIVLNGEDITAMEPHARAQAGMFLSFQTPLALSGVKVYQLLQLAMHGKKDPLKIRNEAKAYAKELGISEELLNRPLNEGASGGERKKMEVLQAAVLGKSLLIFDEVDTGVDVDALKSISKFLIKYKKDKTYIVITHYNRILHYLKPDHVLVMVEGKIVKVGGPELAKTIEDEGYEAFT